MTPPVLPNAAARRLFLDRHALAEAPGGAVDDAGLLALVSRLGFVQVDSIRTVERAHDMILFARRTRYRPDRLRPLLERDRALFEHWTHDAAILPTAFWPHWRLRFARDAERLRDDWRRWHGPDCFSAAEAALDHVRRHGASTARAAGGEAPRSKATAGWWDWRPAKTALEWHWRTGALAVARREGFEKVYDLTERVIPETARAAAPDAAETLAWACAGALDRLGFATPAEIAAFWAKVTPEEAAAWCAAERAAGRLIEVSVESVDGALRRAFARPDIVEAAAAAPAPPGRLRVLSPFDPALRDRARAERLFGFRYRIEVFTPEAKRRYGYYVFPLLQGDRLVGRIDMRARREAGALVVRAFWPEAGEPIGRARLDRLDAELHRVARFAGCARVDYLDGWRREPLSPP